MRVGLWCGPSEKAAVCNLVHPRTHQASTARATSRPRPASHCLLLRPRAVRFALGRQVSPDLGSGTLASLPPAAHCWPASVSVIQGTWLPPEVGLGAIRHATGQNVTEHEAAQPRPRARGQTEPPGLSEAKP